MCNWFRLLYSRNQHSIVNQRDSHKNYLKPCFHRWCSVGPLFSASCIHCSMSSCALWGAFLSPTKSSHSVRTLTVMERAIVMFWKPNRKGTGVKGVFTLSLLGVCFHLPCLIKPWSCWHQDGLEMAMAAHSSILAWRIPRMEEPGRLQPVGLQRVGHGWATEQQQHINV